jgi:filamentous hemagglutinin family protein
MLIRPICAAVLLAAGPALANPNNPTVVSGSASFNTTGNTLTVTNSSGAVINWQGFSIGAGETTRFQQPSSSSTVLNRVTGTGSSDIQGALTSNGKVFLVNPNGVLFGPGAQVNVAGLVATSSGITDADFVAGNYRFTDGGAAGPVTSRGTITADNGSVALFAPQVTVGGVITASADILLLAGAQVTLNPAGGLGSIATTGSGVLITEPGLVLNASGAIIVAAGAPSLPSPIPVTPIIALPSVLEPRDGTIISSSSFAIGSGSVTLGSVSTAPVNASMLKGGVIAMTSPGTPAVAPNATVSPAAGLTLNLQKREVGF